QQYELQPSETMQNAHVTEYSRTKRARLRGNARPECAPLNVCCVLGASLLARKSARRKRFVLGCRLADTTGMRLVSLRAVAPAREETPRHASIDFASSFTPSHRRYRRIGCCVPSGHWSRCDGGSESRAPSRSRATGCGEEGRDTRRRYCRPHRGLRIEPQRVC